MATIEDKLTGLLILNGMFESQAKEVMRMVKEEDAKAKGGALMADRWEDKEEDYPKPLIASLWFMVKRNAVEWIDANLPQAWYRSMFVD